MFYSRLSIGIAIVNKESFKNPASRLSSGSRNPGFGSGNHLPDPNPGSLDPDDDRNDLLWTVSLCYVVSAAFKTSHVRSERFMAFCLVQGRSQEFAKGGGQKRGSGRRKSPSGDQGQTPGGVWG